VLIVNALHCHYADTWRT